MVNIVVEPNCWFKQRQPLSPTKHDVRRRARDRWVRTNTFRLEGDVRRRTHVNTLIAFAAVLQNARFRPVQGLKIVLTSRSSAGEGFHYLPCSAGFDFQPVTGAGEQSILFPTPASGGGYNYSVLVPEEFGIAAIGAHFLQGEFGALFRPLDEHPVIKLRASTAGEFISLVKLQYGLSLSGFSWGRFATVVGPYSD